jgi:L-threonylcarbamoyladenylate synthase
MIVDGKKKAHIDMAVELIRQGDVVAFPTETVYGLGADALNVEGVRKIFEVKGRPESNPLIIHVADHSQLQLVAKNVPETALKLISRFWPGPLTLVLSRNERVPREVTAGLDTVAVRMPRNLIALALIKNSNRVIAAPSANRFQSISPTTAEAVEQELGDRVSLILDGGPCSVGVESTVLSLIDEPTLLRLGGVSVEDIEDVLGRKVKPIPETTGAAMAAPGMLNFHYAPRKSLRFVTAGELGVHVKARGAKKSLGKSVLVCFSKTERKKFEGAGFRDIFVLSSRGNFEEAAQNLYSTLRRIDAGTWEKIYALECPDERLGSAINDRLRKAAHE